MAPLIPEQPARREPGRDWKKLGDHRQDGNVEAHRLHGCFLCCRKMLSKKTFFRSWAKLPFLCCRKSHFFYQHFPTQLFRSEFVIVRILSEKFTFFRAATVLKNAIEKVFESDCAASHVTHTHTEDQCEWHIMTRMTGPDCAVMCNLINTHTHTHHRHKQPSRMRACTLVELVGLVGLDRCQSYTPGSTAGRVI